MKNYLKEIPWSFEIFYYIFITTQKNPISFPLLIEYGDEIYVSPTRLKVALRLMNQKLIHNYISNELIKKFEIEFQNVVIKLLKEKKINVEDPITKIQMDKYYG